MHMSEVTLRKHGPQVNVNQRTNLILYKNIGYISGFNFIHSEQTHRALVATRRLHNMSINFFMM